MSKATTTKTKSPVLHASDSHDLIRVHGARENNLKDVTVELPKRRLTVFTGVSGSGKSWVLATVRPLSSPEVKWLGLNRRIGEFRNG